MHDALYVGVPLVAILAGILFNRSDTGELRGELKDFRSELSARLDRIDSDLRQFYHLAG